jgi:hypothetical protein
MKTMERLFGPSNIDLQRQKLTYNVIELIQPLIELHEILFSVKRKSNIGVNENLELFDRLIDCLSDPSKRIPINNSHLDLSAMAVDKLAPSLEASASTSEFDDEFDISVLQINTTTDDIPFERFHAETKCRVIAYLRALLSSSSLSIALVPVVETLAGHALQNNNMFFEALQLYSNSNLVSQNSLAYCVLQLFVQRTNAEKFEEEFSELIFIYDALKVNMIVGMHTYRLILELVFTELQSKQLGGDKYMTSPILLGSFRCFPRSGANTIARK